jgi:hypothetical protein
MYQRITTKVRTNLDHRTVTSVLGTGVAVDDLGHHRQNTTKAQDMKEPEDPSLPLKNAITKTMKKRWEHNALIT